jgi:uncharacterized protein (DUF1330 family)
MKGYLFTKSRIFDLARYLKYVEAVEALVVRYQGTFIVRSTPVEVMEGELDKWRGFVHLVIEFPSVDRAREFWLSEDYREIRKLRKDVGEVHAMLTEELDVEAFKERAGA